MAVMAVEHARMSISPAPEREALAGLVERVTYHNPENGFCVCGSRCAASAISSP